MIILHSHVTRRINISVYLLDDNNQLFETITTRNWLLIKNSNEAERSDIHFATNNSNEAEGSDIHFSTNNSNEAERSDIHFDTNH